MRAQRVDGDATRSARRRRPTAPYHNHDHEFVPLGDGTAFDALVDQTTIGFEFDAGWAHAAGQDPVELIRRLDGRVPVVHLTT